MDSRWSSLKAEVVARSGAADQSPALAAAVSSMMRPAFKQCSHATALEGPPGQGFLTVRSVESKSMATSSTST